MNIRACLDLAAFLEEMRIDATLKMTPIMTLEAAMMIEIVCGSSCTLNHQTAKA
jgi:hypothetical protein